MNYIAVCTSAQGWSVFTQRVYRLTANTSQMHHQKKLLLQGHLINKEEIAVKHLAGFAEKELWNVILKCSVWKWVHKMAGIYSFSSCEPRARLADTVVTAVLVEMCQL